MKFFFTLLTCAFYFQLFAGKKCESTPLGNSRAITLSVTTINTTCQKSNGKIIAQATGGVTPYTYSISGSPQSSGIFFGLPAGNYTVTATDAIGDATSQSVTLTNTFLSPSPVVISALPPSGCNTFDAKLTLAGTGGLAPYTYSLDNINYQTSNTFSNLTAGTYYYAVKDANGCSSFPSLILYVKTIRENCSVMYINGYAAALSCNPFKVDNIRLNGTIGGTPPYTYSKDGINYQSSNEFSNLPDGFHTFWIKDAAGFIFLTSASFMDYCPRPFLITNVVQTAYCGQNGSITVNASEGAVPYQYSLDGITFQPGNQFNGLTPDLYTVTVKDSDGLIATRLANVPNNCAVVTTVTTNATCGYNNGKIVAQASNGTAPYQFSVDGINYSANNIFANLAAGNYTVYTKDATGAIGTANVVISNIAGPNITSISTTASGCDNQSGVINVIAGSGTAPLVYSTNGTVFQASPVFNGLAPGNYTVTVKDANNCIAVSPATVMPSSNMPQVNLGKDTTLCEDQTLLLSAVNPGAGYLWQDGSSQSSFLVTGKGMYYVSVNNQGCVARDTIIIDYQLKPRFTLGEDKRLCPGNSFVLKPTITNNASLQGLNYLWQDGSAQPTYRATQEGFYRLELSNYCGYSSDEIMISKGICDLYIPNSFTPNNDGLNDLFKVGYGDNVIEFQMQVYNRYGQLVFETKDKTKGWDGTVKGNKQQQGTYTWGIRYKTVVGSMWQELTGTVILIR